MNKNRIICLLLAIAMCLGVCACGAAAPAQTSTAHARQAARTEHTARPSASNATEEPSDISAEEPSPPTEPPQEIAAASTPQALEGTGETFAVIPYNGEQIPAYSGEEYISVNGGTPFFSPNELADISYETYGDLDSLGRCTAALASIGTDLMPTEKRQSIQEVKPSGWNQAFYDIVENEALYNRSHLIGYQLTAENANPNNLITGTRYMNAQGMLPFENLVADYVKETDNHVLYRVTPIFIGDELVARGVLMEGQSVEDDGDGVMFCEFIYNVQPGIGINYADGSSWLVDESAGSQNTTLNQIPANSAPPEATVLQSHDVEEASDISQSPITARNEADTSAAEEQPEVQVNSRTYVLNTNTHKFHDPSCSSVSDMNPANAQEFTGTREEVIALGYVPCKRCNP